MKHLDDPLLIDLRRWGWHEANRYNPYPKARDEDPTPDDHPLARARHEAPGTRERAAKLLAGRDGRSRRATVGAAAGVKGMHTVPKWSSDPVRCKQTPGTGWSAAIDRGIPVEYRWVVEALANLRRTQPTREVVVRTEFTVAASQAAKARIASDESGRRVSRWQYRRELALGLAFLSGMRPSM